MYGCRGCGNDSIILILFDKKTFIIPPWKGTPWNQRLFSLFLADRKGEFSPECFQGDGFLVNGLCQSFSLSSVGTVCKLCVCDIETSFISCLLLCKSVFTDQYARFRFQVECACQWMKGKHFCWYIFLWEERLTCDPTSLLLIIASFAMLVILFLRRELLGTHLPVVKTQTRRMCLYSLSFFFLCMSVLYGCANTWPDLHN